MSHVRLSSRLEDEKIALHITTRSASRGADWALDRKGILIMTYSVNGGRLAHEIELGFAGSYGLRHYLSRPPEEKMKVNPTSMITG